VRHLDLFADISNDDIAVMIDKWVKGSRNREIMRDRLIDAMTYERIAEKHDLSVRYVKTLIYHQEEIIFKHF
jgi:hypothetical protein